MLAASSALVKAADLWSIGILRDGATEEYAAAQFWQLLGGLWAK